MSVRDVQFVEGVTVIEPSNLYECRIGDNAFIGPFVEIQKGAVIGNRTRVQSHIFVCELVTIGDDCFVGHGVMFINDLFSDGDPAASAANWKPTCIGNHVSIGSSATILPVTICDHVVIGAGAVVTKSFPQGRCIIGGVPARLLKEL